MRWRTIEKLDLIDHKKSDNDFKKGNKKQPNIRAQNWSFFIKKPVLFGVDKNKHISAKEMGKTIFKNSKKQK